MRERGIEPHIYYANSNIVPKREYERRLDTIKDWATCEKIDFTEGEYLPSAWERCVGETARKVEDGCIDRQQRCRECYRMRFEESARYASENGFCALGTTLSVSPYQYTDVIREELQRAADMFGLQSAFEDYSPFYAEATRRSREAKMYRQNFCGCAPSAKEAEEERRVRAELRAQMREEKHKATAEAREKQQVELARRKKERAEYDAKRTRQKQILKELREAQKL